MLTKLNSIAGDLFTNHPLLTYLRRAFLASSCDREAGTLEIKWTHIYLQLFSDLQVSYVCL